MTRYLPILALSLTVFCTEQALGQQKPGVTPDEAVVGHLVQPVTSVRLDSPVGGDNGNNRVPNPRHPLGSMSGLGDIIAGDALSKLEYSIFGIDVHDPGPSFPPLFPTGNSGYSRSGGPIPAVPTALPMLVLGGLAVSRRRR